MWTRWAVFNVRVWNALFIQTYCTIPVNIATSLSCCVVLLAAHIGVGISGKEGRQAVLSSDFSFAQFRYIAFFICLYVILFRSVSYRSLARSFRLVTFWFVLSCPVFSFYLFITYVPSFIYSFIWSFVHPFILTTGVIRLLSE